MRFLFLIIFQVILQLTHAQSTYRPTIITLDPHSRVYDSASQNEIVILNESLRGRKKQVAVGFETDKQKEMLLDSLFNRFQERMDFFSTLTLDLAGGLNLALLGKSENIFSFPIHHTSDGNLDDFQKIAVDNNVSWVLNPREIQIETLNDVRTVKIQLQLYSSKLNQVLIDRVYTANSKNLDPFLKCQDNSLECCIDHITSQASAFILLTISNNSKYW